MQFNKTNMVLTFINILDIIEKDKIERKEEILLLDSLIYDITRYADGPSENDFKKIIDMLNALKKVNIRCGNFRQDIMDILQCIKF